MFVSPIEIDMVKVGYLYPDKVKGVVPMVCSQIMTHWVSYRTAQIDFNSQNKRYNIVLTRR